MRKPIFDASSAVFIKHVTSASGHLMSSFCISPMNTRIIVFTILSTLLLDVGAWLHIIFHFIPYYAIISCSVLAMKHLLLSKFVVFRGQNINIIFLLKTSPKIFKVSFLLQRMTGQPSMCPTVDKIYFSPLTPVGNCPGKSIKNILNNAISGV